MLVSDFDFELPAELIADAAVEPRDAARLLVYERSTGAVHHRHFRDLPDFLDADDLLVLNNTRVLPHRLFGQRHTGGKVEVLILERRGALCRGYVKPARKLRPGDEVALEGGALRLIAGEAEGGGLMHFELAMPPGEAGDVEARLLEVGRAPLPPYIHRDGSEDPAADRERYQTVFAKEPGAVAAPTAGLHFTPELLERLTAQGLQRTEVTLHVGPGTFAPVRVEAVEDHRMHAEVYELPESCAAAVAATRQAGGRVVAVGTTATRTLESCVRPGRLVAAGTGSTDIFLYPGKQLQVVDALITNFHLPQSTLIMLVAAMVGREKVLELYREAVGERYRFYSFGDAMLIL